MAKKLVEGKDKEITVLALQPLSALQCGQLHHKNQSSWKLEACKYKGRGAVVTHPSHEPVRNWFETVSRQYGRQNFPGILKKLDYCLM